MRTNFPYGSAGCDEETKECVLMRAVAVPIYKGSLFDADTGPQRLCHYG